MKYFISKKQNESFQLLVNGNIYDGFVGFWFRGLKTSFLICMLILFGYRGMAQTENSSMVQLKVTDTRTNNSKSGNVTENKSIGFFISGMKSEEDARTIEILLNNQKGIYGPRANYNASYCAFVTQKESDIDETFVKKLLDYF